MLLGFISLPTFASPPILMTDFLERGEHMLGGEYAHSRVDGEGRISTGDDVDTSSNQNEVAATYGFGFTESQMLTLVIPYIFANMNKATIKSDDTDIKYKASSEGLGDLSIEYRFLFRGTETRRLAAWLGATIPVGDDDTGESEIVRNGSKTQSMKKGGAGSGFTNYEAGLSFSQTRGKSTFFSSINYALNGSKTEEGEKQEPGDAIELEVGVLQEIDVKSRIGGKLEYGYAREGKSGDDDISSYSIYGVSLAYFYHVAENFLFSPQLSYVKASERKTTNRTDGSTNKASVPKAIFLGVELKKTF